MTLSPSHLLALFTIRGAGWGSMGASGSKTAGNAAAAASKTVRRRRLPDAPSASSMLASDQSSRSREGASTSAPTATSRTSLDTRSGRVQDSRSPSPRAGLDPDATFFRPLRANDGSLAPFAASAADADVERRVREKDTTLVRRMDQLAGAISMSRVEISGHRRAAERAERRREAMSRTPKIRVQDLAAFFRRQERANGASEETAASSSAETFSARLEAPVVAAAARFFRHAEPVSVTTETTKGGPPIVRLIKRWDGRTSRVHGD